MKESIHIGGIHDQQREIVEHKGSGHPDSVCDSISEAVSRALCHYYQSQFGAIMHHNVDKALLIGGQSQPAFGGGAVLKPMTLLIAGTATQKIGNQTIPVNDIASTTTKQWFIDHFRHLDPQKHLVFQSHLRPGSEDLVDLFLRIQKGDTPLANDTSFGTGYYPPTDLENTVLQMAALIEGPVARRDYPFLGEDFKIMGVRQGDQIWITLAVAAIDQYLESAENYRLNMMAIKDWLYASLNDISFKLDINTADDYERQSLFLTVTGTSAEHGDDGQVGRGNRLNRLITPYQPMSLEATSGKNPISHIGKIYNYFAFDLSKSLVLAGMARTAQVFIVSQIGKPIDQPQLVHIRMTDQMASEDRIRQEVMSRLDMLSQYYQTILSIKN